MYIVLHVRPLGSYMWLARRRAVTCWSPASKTANHLQAHRALKLPSIAHPTRTALVGSMALHQSTDQRPWVVLKFGGTSVATAKNWACISDRVQELLPRHRVWLVHSALSQVTNLLERSIDAAIEGDEAECMKIFHLIQHKHYVLARDTRLCEDIDAADTDTDGTDGAEGDRAQRQSAALSASEVTRPLVRLLRDLQQLLDGVRLTEEASPRLRARISSFGELLATRLGAAILSVARVRGGGGGQDVGGGGEGKDDGAASTPLSGKVAWVDARRLLLCGSSAVAVNAGAAASADAADAAGPGTASTGIFEAIHPTAGVAEVVAKSEASAAGASPGADAGALSEEDRYLEASILPRRALEGEVEEAIKAGALVYKVPLASAAAGGQDECDGYGSVVVTQGFIGSTAARAKSSNKRQGAPGGCWHTCLLGRGGSDTSSALFAALIGAVKLEIWTDVHGMFTADPRKMPAARLIKHISYREAQELAAMGAKVLHPRCIGPARWAGITIEIRNTIDPRTTHCTSIGQMPRGAATKVMAVVQRSSMTLLTLKAFEMWGASGFLSQFFAPFEEMGVSVDLIATSQYAVSVTLDHIPGGTEGAIFSRLVARLKRLGDVEVVVDCVVVSIVGRQLRKALHLLGPALRSLRGFDVHLLSESTEDLNLSIVVTMSQGDVEELQQRTNDLLTDLHDLLILGTRISSRTSSPIMNAAALAQDEWRQLDQVRPRGASDRVDVAAAADHALGPDASSQLPALGPAPAPHQTSEQNREHDHQHTQEPLSPMLGPSWELLNKPGDEGVPSPPPMAHPLPATSLVGSVEPTPAPQVEQPEELRHLDKDLALQVASRFGTPCFVYSLEALRVSALKCLRFPHDTDGNFGLTVRFAMKACPTGAVLRALTAHGLYIDASSGYEVERAMLAGVPPARISLSTQQLPDISTLTALLDAGVHINACSLGQLSTIGKTRPGARVGVRFNPGLGSGDHGKKNVGGPLSSFGIWHTLLPRVLATAAAHSLQIDTVHTHIGSGSDPAVWERVSELSLRIVARIPTVTSLNLGGGFKTARMRGETEIDFDAVGTRVRERLRAFARETGRQLRLEIEPGTALVATAGSLVCGVQDVVETVAGDDGLGQRRRFVKLDAGMTEIIRPSLYASQHPLVLVQANMHNDTSADTDADDSACDAIVVGHCCETGDLLTPKPGDAEVPVARRFHATPRVGDILVVEGAGAYCSSMAAKNYNSFPEAAEVMLLGEADSEGSRLRLIRKRQTLSQMTENEVELDVDFAKLK